ncbi:MAG: hypothetical protein AAF203_09585 [Pseudomonadota bacterium]
MSEKKRVYELVSSQSQQEPSFVEKFLLCVCSLIAFVIVIAPVEAKSSFDIFLEAGGVWQNRNDVEIEPGTGTRVEIDRANEGPFFHYRLEGYYRINKHHALRLVYAPSTIEVTQNFTQDVNFNDQTFAAGQDIDIRYQFNSYRLSYLYGFLEFGGDQVNIGFTAKIRDAETRFSQPGLSSSFSNVGFVPLIYFELQKELTKKWILNLTMDAAAASQGRAIDVALKVRRQIGESTQVGMGYRTLEGGADNDEVFTFSWFNYATVDLAVSF